MPAIDVQVGDRVHAGKVQRGESWAAAAGRIAGGAVPMPIDLSGEPKRFEVDDDLRVLLRAMTRDDLPDVLRWRRADHVRRWFHPGQEPTLQSVTERYGPRIDGDQPTRMWVVEVNGRSVGFVQDYRIRDYPDFAVLTPEPDAIGGDYLIGELAWTGRGIGTKMLWTWLLGLPARFPDATTVFSSPDHRNLASLRVLEKVGFAQGASFHEPQPDGMVDTLIGCTLQLRTVIGQSTSWK